MSTKLAILGGNKIRTKPFPAPNTIGNEEKKAVMSVLDSGVLSRFLGVWHNDFYGGEQVQQFERNWAEYVNVKFAVSVNSAASGLLAAIGAAGVAPGDEVIVTPYTMSASATAIVNYGGVPVFADLDDDIYCLEPKSIESKITPRTKAIMVVHIFGHPADMDEILAIAKKHNLVVIEDAAQAPGAIYKGKKVGGLGGMTVFSLNYHKHIHTGEGGMVTTNNAEYAERLQLIRNHGESVVGDKGVKNISNTFGYNLRMTEISAAIGIEQLKKLPTLLDQRIINADFLSKEIAKFPGIKSPKVKPGCRHVYYIQPFRFDERVVGVPRDQFIDAVNAELPTAEDRDWTLMSGGYVKPLYLLPMFQQQIAFGTSGFPFKSPHYKGVANYNKGICPVVERIDEKEIMCTEFMRPPSTLEDMKDVVKAFEKVYENRNQLKELARA
jgi:dTDP-4-amino-4,6-dideoxygalactose transaminase